ncbi:hypothetical protein [Bythopirellula polymerisocia]|uniref:Uncharacterized protein n=1 Tax=Bythopirellula polymerisocia TaxID=2528003 RepID=A0A5C6D570_9BACT|nr:hypothetical protein [Bythopirellula polymerisocia]TWU30039.1 hypothetical protein Pla144_08250 [Bythopirellula polymerisocia]
MANTLDQMEANLANGDLPFQLTLELTVSDPDTIRELAKYDEGEPRDEFALEALKIGVLTLRRASASIDSEFIKHETNRLLENLQKQFQSHAESSKQRIEDSLGKYFNPQDGHFTQRVKQLASADGEVGRMIRSLVDGNDSHLAKTMLTHIGETSPLMKHLSPDQSQGLLAVLHTKVESQLASQREKILKEFSLDNPEGALCRLVSEVTGKHGDFTRDMKGKIDEVVKEFSLNDENSSLSRLVKKVNTAQETITQEFSLDNDQSSLRKMQTHLETILGAHIKSAADFQEEVKVALGKLITKRETEARSTLHGGTFEDAVLEFVSRDGHPRGETVEGTGSCVGRIKNCKVGDVVVELGCDSAAAGAKIVIEAKEDASYTIAKSREEIEQARKNRDAQLGIFIFSQRTAPAHCDSFRRYGSDLLVVWDAEDPTTDANLKAALEVARALCIRARQATEKKVDFTTIDKAILDIEKRVQNLDEIRKSTETIRNANEKIFDRVRIDGEALDKQLGILKECLGDLKENLGSEIPSKPLLTPGK